MMESLAQDKKSRLFGESLSTQSGSGVSSCDYICCLSATKRVEFRPCTLSIEQRRLSTRDSCACNKRLPEAQRARKL